MTNDEAPQIIPQPQMGLPISQNLELTEYLLGNKPMRYEDKELIEGDLPHDMVSFFWGFFSLDLLTSNFDDRQIRTIMEEFKAMRKLYIANISPSELTIRTIHQLDNLEVRVQARLLRALHGFERQKMTEQTQQTIYGQVNPQGFGQRQGIVSSIRDRFFGVPQ
jgi:hypothetical protein